MKSPARQYVWKNFWYVCEEFRDDDDENEESARWVAAQDEEDRLVFELEVEAMIEESISKYLEGLRQAYKACNWTTMSKNADCELCEAILAVVIDDNQLDSDSVFDRLREAHNIQECETLSPHPEDKRQIPILLSEPLPPRPEFALPFPRANLDIFIACVDHDCQLTIRAFERSYYHFLKSLPETVRATLDRRYVNLIMPALMDKLREQGNP